MREEHQEAINKALSIIEGATDAEIKEYLEAGVFNQFLLAIAPKTFSKKIEPVIYEHLLENKWRFTTIALFRHAIQQNYALKGKVAEKDVRVSPDIHQWFDDGVMFLQGEEPFAGLIGLYQDGEVKFAISARDAKEGDKLGPDDFIFVSHNEAGQYFDKSKPIQSQHQLDEAIEVLEELLDSKSTDEGDYQQYLQDNPWIFGARYKKIQSHRAFDDDNIPDFTGVGFRDGARDIFEIKQPFLSLFRKDGKFRSEFNDAWNQAERYLDFARRESDYLLRQKGLRFENPHCYLLLGHGLSDNEVRALRAKERMNPAITIFTYEDLLMLAKNTVSFIKKLL